ncbi:MAG: hypothetical protein KC620_09280 [Myxococcales bacterium]|nr:hypothetical protein [Myxococcales bacterium]
MLSSDLRRALLRALLAVCAIGCTRKVDPERLAAASANTRYGVFQDRMSGIDPLDIGAAAAAVGINVFETLYQYHYLRRPYVLVPMLARALPEISDGGLTYVIRLRDDVVFADDPAFPGGKGRPLVAADFVFALKRLADAQNASPHWALINGRIAGLDAWHAASMAPDFDFDAPVEGLIAVDAHTLRFQLVKPWPQLPHVLAMLPTAPVAREVVQHYGDAARLHPVGTGPYRLASWKQDVDITLTRNPTWRGEPYPSEGEPGDREKGLLADAGRPMPFIDALHFDFVQAGQPSWLLFLDGALDYHGTPGQNFDQIVGPDRHLTPQMTQQGIELYLFESSFSRFVGLNMADPLIAGNKPLRRAISHALDRREFNEVFLSGRNDQPVGLIPPALRGAGQPKPHPNITSDLEAAKRALAEAVAQNGGPLPRLKMIYGGQGGVQRQVGQLLVRNFAAAGLDVTIEYVDEGVAYRRVAAERKAQLIFGMGHHAAYPDAIDLFKRFYGPNIETEVNVFSYRNPAFDALYEQAAVLPDTPARAALYQRMEAMLLDDLPAIPYTEYNHFFVIHDWLDNCKPHAFYGPSGMAKYQRLDIARRVAALRAR